MWALSRSRLTAWTCRISPQVMVVTSEGIFYSYSIDLEHGGECVLQKSYSLIDQGLGGAGSGGVGDAGDA